MQYNFTPTFIPQSHSIALSYIELTNKNSPYTYTSLNHTTHPLMVHKHPPSFFPHQIQGYNNKAHTHQSIIIAHIVHLLQKITNYDLGLQLNITTY